MYSVQVLSFTGMVSFRHHNSLKKKKKKGEFPELSINRIFEGEMMLSETWPRYRKTELQ